MTDVTALIITKNEEKNIADCVKSILGFVKRVLIIDSGSNDATVEIAEKLGCEVYFHVFETHAKQRNWALDNISITTQWILRIDADERLTPELCDELEQLMILHKDDDVNGITMEAWLFFMGKKITHGCHNKRKLMLFKTGMGRIEERRMDEHTILTNGTSVEAKNRFIHYDYKDLNHWISKMNWYATREMQDYFDFVNGKSTTLGDEDKVIVGTRKKKFGFYYKLPLFFRSWLLFVYYYVFRLGFLDGKEGFVYNWMYHRWYRCLVDSKILEQKITNRPFEEMKDL